MPPASQPEPTQPSTPQPVSTPNVALPPTSVPPLQGPPTVAPTVLPIPPIPPSVPAPSPSSKLSLILGIAAIVILIAGAGTYYILGRSKTPVTKLDSKTTGGTQEKLLSIPGIKLNSHGYLDESVYADGVQSHNTSGNDSLREYKELKDMQTVAEGFVSSLGSHDWPKAYGYFSSAKTKEISQTTITDQWKHEYLENFTLASMMQNALGGSARSEFALDTCRKDFSLGWSKDIQNGAYKSPFFSPRGLKDTTVSAQIDLALVKEGGVWKVSGESNERHDASGVVNGDPYATAQAKRPFVNPWNCD